MAVLSDYMSGLISLAKGSVTVTGTGTMFKTVGLKAGATLLIQNLTAVIVSVDSNTKLTLAEPWTGTSLVSAPYRARFLPDGTTVTATTAALIEMLGNGNLEALAGLVSRADMLAYFTGAGTADVTALTEWARTLLAAANGGKGYEALGAVPDGSLRNGLKSLTSSPLSDANSISENGWHLTSNTADNIPISGQYWYIMHINNNNGSFSYQTAYSFSGAEDRLITYSRKKIDNTWRPWYLTGTTVLGNVTQSGGVPSGAIIQRGSNANGEFIRFADGTQICWHFLNVSITSNAATEIPVTFPASFINTGMSVMTTPSTPSPSSFHPITLATVTTNGGTFGVQRPGGGTGAVFRYIAIGRWF